MKATLKVDSVGIKDALMKQYARLGATRVDINVTLLVDERYGHNMGYNVSAEVEIEVDA